MDVIITKSAQKELLHLPKNIVQQIEKRLMLLERDEMPSDVKKLQGEEDAYRVRVGEYRIVCGIDWKKRRVVVIKIRIRGQAYRN